MTRTPPPPPAPQPPGGYTVGGFMAAIPAPTGSNTPWGERYASEIRQIITHTASQAPRSLQIRLGPSELGVRCDRQIVGKLAGEPRTNNVSDPWPSIIGTAGHAWMEAAMQRENIRLGYQRWITELEVAPTPAHPGHTDLYDAREQAVCDYKFLGDSSLAKIKSGHPPRKYHVQLLLYGLGCVIAGLPVKRVVIIALPRTASTLSGMYVWDHPFGGPEDIALLQEVLRVTEVRKQIAARIREGVMRIEEVPVTTDDDECFFCVTGETQTVTRKGIKPISELAGGVHELLVPSVGPKGGLKARGHFKPAAVQEFGRQRIWTVRLGGHHYEKTIRATAEHRWILAAGKGWALDSPEAYERTTSQLLPGDRLRALKARAPARAEIMPVAVAQGFTFGDGTIGQDRRPATLAIYDNGKDDALLPYFALAKPTDYPAYTEIGNAVKMIYGLPRFWKKLPPLDESRTFLLSWLAGYFAADGHVDKVGTPSISSVSETNIRFVRDIAAICGVGYGKVRFNDHSGYGPGLTRQWSLGLQRRDLPEWFFVIAEHRLRAARANERPAHESSWIVEEVTETTDIETVYCAVVPGVGAFGLADNLMTGNCPFYRPQSAYDNGPGCPGTINNRPS